MKQKNITLEKQKLSQTVESIYNNRKEFIIIGLTGRTGAGCTTVANLLGKKFVELEAPIPEGNATTEDRQYHFIYEYAKKNWENNRFTIIEMKNVIFSFILEEEYKFFKDYLEKYFSNYFEDNSFKKYYQSNNKFLKRTYQCLKNRLEEYDINSVSETNYKELFKIYFEEIPEFVSNLTVFLKNINLSSYTEMMQSIGNNIRLSGAAFDSNINPDNIFNLSYKANQMIKILRKKAEFENKGVLVVIDAFRNPYEVTFFKDRYSAFYLFSVNATDIERKNRLSKYMLPQSIKELDDQEFPKSKNTIEDFCKINIQKTIELSDVHLSNHTDLKFIFTKKQIVRYVTLIMHPGIVTPTDIERCMQIAFNAKLNSGCLSRQVGASITDNKYSLRSIGWNSAPVNQIPCNLRDIRNICKEDYNDEIAMSYFERSDEEYIKYIKEETKKINFELLKGRMCTYCFKDAYNAYKDQENQVYTRSIHAEEMAFLDISKHGGTGLDGGFLFTTASPCELCSKKACHIGIKKIYYIDQYPGISYAHIIKCGSDYSEMELFHGAIGRAYNQFYSQVMSYKDELYMLLGLKFNSNKKNKKYRISKSDLNKLKKTNKR